jgi:hypothetical protein
MLATLAAIAALQAMPQAELIREGGQIGRAAYAMGACMRIGYTVFPEALEQWQLGFGHRATASGWSERVASAAIRMGTSLESAEMDSRSPEPGLSAQQLRDFTGEMFNGLKARCHRLASEHPELIGNLDQGDRNADAELAIMLAPLNE